MNGRCLCGACTYSGHAAAMETGVCHCETCRRWAGGVLFSVDLGDRIDVAEGAPLLVYASSPGMDRVSCARCGAAIYRYSRVLNRYFAVMQALDSPGDFDFMLQIFIDEKPANYDFANKTVTLTGPEAMAMLEQGTLKG
ncbi:MAG: GFA family protein [Paracoccus sp. (in: a-proteobacteria)]